MKTTLLMLVLSLTLASPLATAQTKDDHSAHHPPGQGEPAAGAQAEPPAIPATSQGAPSAVDEGMKHLRELMTQIEQTNDPAEREALLHEHMIAMLEQIKLLRSQAEGMSMAMMMMGGGQMGMGGERNAMAGEKKENATKTDKKSKGGGGMMGGGMMGDGMMGQRMRGMHKVMERRLDMLQQLLEQSIKHAHMREATEH